MNKQWGFNGGTRRQAKSDDEAAAVVHSYKADTMESPLHRPRAQRLMHYCMLITKIVRLLDCSISRASAELCCKQAHHVMSKCLDQNFNTCSYTSATFNQIT